MVFARETFSFICMGVGGVSKIKTEASGRGSPRHHDVNSNNLFGASLKHTGTLLNSLTAMEKSCKFNHLIIKT